MSLRLFKEKNIIIAALMITGIFMMDLFTPLWYEVWVLYLIPLFFMHQSAKRPYVYSAIVALLIVAGLFLSPSDSTSLMHALANRITGIFGGLAVSVLLMQLKRLNVSQLQSCDELEKRVDERTTELSQANRSLQNDIDERKKIEEASRDRGERYRLLFHKTPIGIFTYDTQLILIAWNERFMEILQSSQEKLLGLDMKTLKDQSVIPAIRKAIEGDEGHYEGLYRPTTGPAEIWVSLRTAPIFDQDGKVNNGVGIVEDITARKKMEDQLRSLSLTDELTGFYNRRGFFTLAEKLVKIAKRQRRGLFMLYADLDGLKEINDTWGHQEGDLALIDIANIFRAAFRESDVVARIGGDEFVVIPVGRTGDDTRIIDARLQESIDAHNAKREKGYTLSMSWGISYYDPENPCSIDELLSHADKLMYERKKNPEKP